MNTISTFVIAVFVFSFLFLAMSESVNAGTSPPSLFMFPGCCQFSSGTEGVECGVIDDGGDIEGCLFGEGMPLSGETCNDVSGLCSGFVPPVESRNVPTLSEWGLVAMAGILGFIGFMFIRRRKVTA